jgi:exopolysaccharide production protein ExoQ
MPSIIALFLCTLYVAVLLMFEKKRNPGFSRALWIPTAWMLIAASKPVGTWLGRGSGAAEGSVVDQVFLTALLVMAAVVFLRRKFDWADIARKSPFVLLVIGFMLISVAWSGIPFVSLKRWSRELIAVAMALVVLTEKDPHAATICVFRRVMVILIPLSLVLIKYFPQYGVEFGRWSGERMWIGATLQKNGLGRLSMLSAFLYVWSFARKIMGDSAPERKTYVFADISVFLISLYLLKSTPGSYSATGIVSFVVGVGIFFLLLGLQRARIRLGRYVFAFVVVALVSFAIYTVLAGGKTVGSATSALGRNTTLTGRTDVWASLVPVFKSKPILGRGFGSFWTTKTRILFDIPDAHSGYLDVLLETGIIGMLLLTAFLVHFSVRAQSFLREDFFWGSFCICCAVMALIHNMSESSFNSFSSHLTAVLIFLSIASSKSVSPSVGVKTGTAGTLASLTMAKKPS